MTLEPEGLGRNFKGCLQEELALAASLPLFPPALQEREEPIGLITLSHLIASVLWKLFSLSLCYLISVLLTPLLGPTRDNSTKIYCHFSF